MVSTLPLCVTVGLSLCQPNTMSEDITQQKHYSEVTVEEMNEIMNEALAPISYTRSIVDLETIDYIEGYYDYVEEQERLEQERIAEEQRKLEEEQRRIEEEQRLEAERQRQAWVNSFDRQDYRQTVYSISEGEVHLGSGLYYGHPSVKTINNVMHYNDSEYGWLPIYAININEVLASGFNSKGTPNLYGSVIEVKQGDRTWYASVMDACGACSSANKIDLWVYNVDLSLDIAGLDWKIVRYGY